MTANLENSAVATRLEKDSFYSKSKQGKGQRILKVLYKSALSHASKFMGKILQARLQQYKNWELPDVQAGLRKGRGTSDQIVNIRCIMEKQGNFREKKYTSASLTMLKPLTGWTTTNWKILKRWEYHTALPVSWGTCMQVKKQQLEQYIDQQTDSKLGKEYNKAVYCHSAYLTSVQSISCEMSGSMNHKLKSGSWLQGEILTTSYKKMNSTLIEEGKE